MKKYNIGHKQKERDKMEKSGKYILDFDGGEIIRRLSKEEKFVYNEEEGAGEAPDEISISFESIEELIIYLLPSGLSRKFFAQLEAEYYLSLMPETYITAKEYLEREGISRTSLTERIRKGKVSTAKAGGYLYVKS